METTLKLKILIKILKFFGYQLFECGDKTILCGVSNHSVKRAERRITLYNMLRIISEMAIQYGENSVHFDFYKKEKEKKYHQEGVFAKKFKGYIFIFNKENILLTVYNVSNIADLMITRKYDNKP